MYTNVDQEHTRPDGTTDATVEAVGRVSEALEVIEHARGSLYEFHQKIGRADIKLAEAVELLRTAGHSELADKLEREIVGRNILYGRWTFQIVEEFDDGYYAELKAYDKQVRDQLMDGKRHVYEAEMKAREITPGEPGHEPTPAS